MREVGRIGASGQDGATRTAVTVPEILSVVGAFAVLAFLYGRFLFQGAGPPIALSGDGANILSFATARLQPEVFVNDPLLGDLGNFDFYRNLSTGLVQLLGRMGLDQLAVGYLGLGPLATFLHGIGFWLLARVIGFGPVASIIASVAMLATCRAITGTYWGGFVDPQPRFQYQAVFPFLLMLAWVWRFPGWRWIPLFVLAAIATYVHPVSGPAVALALWLALLGYNVPQARLMAIGKPLLAAGLVYLVGIGPFLWSFLAGTGGGTGTVPDSRLLEIAQARFAAPYLDPWYAMRDILAWPWGQWHVVILGIALGGLVAFLARPRLLGIDARLSSPLSFMLCFACGLLVTTIVLPLGEVWFSLSQGEYPLQIDLVRASRYLIPVVFFIALLTVHGALYGYGRSVAAAGALSIGVFWLLVSDTTSFLGEGAPLDVAWDHPYAALTDTFENDRLENRKALYRFLRREIPPGSKVYSVRDDITLRYAGKVAVAISDKDGGAFLYANPAAAVNWYREVQTYNKLRSLPLTPESVSKIENHARSLGADYIIFGPDLPKNGNMNALYRNEHFMVVANKPQSPEENTR